MGSYGSSSGVISGAVAGRGCRFTAELQGVPCGMSGDIFQVNAGKVAAATGDPCPFLLWSVFTSLNPLAAAALLQNRFFSTLAYKGLSLLPCAFPLKPLF